MMEREVNRMWILPVEDLMLRQIDPVTTEDVVMGLYAMYPDHFHRDAELGDWVPTIRIILRRLSRDGLVEHVGDRWRIVEAQRGWLTGMVASQIAADQYKRDRRAYVLAAQEQVAAGGELPPHPDSLDRNFNPRRTREADTYATDQRSGDAEAVVRGDVFVSSGMYRADCE